MNHVFERNVSRQFLLDRLHSRDGLIRVLLKVLDHELQFGCTIVEWVQNARDKVPQANFYFQCLLVKHYTREQLVTRKSYEYYRPFF